MSLLTILAVPEHSLREIQMLFSGKLSEQMVIVLGRKTEVVCFEKQLSILKACESLVPSF